MVQPDGGLRVMAPSRMSLRSIEKFLQRRADWIRRKLGEFQARSFHKQSYADGAEAPYGGAMHRLRVTQDETKPCCCALKCGEIHVNIPERPLSGKALEEETRLELFLWYKKEARRVFRERLDHWASAFGVTPGKLFVTNPSRRWGSCNAKNDIRLNWRLIMASEALLDYVVAHELCHIRHKNHARAFWRALESVMPDYKARRRALRGWERGS